MAYRLPTRVGFFSCLAVALTWPTVVLGDEPVGELNRLARNASCLIEANSVAKLSSQSQGVLASVTVRRGDTVKAGQVVATLESGVEEALLKGTRLKAETDALVRSKEAELSNAEKKLSRQQMLAKSLSATIQTLEQVETDVAVLRSQLSQAKLDRQLAKLDTDRMVAVLERRILRSPIDGIVTAVDHYPGEYADSNTVILSLAEVQPLKVQLYLPLAAYPLVNVGIEAVVQPVGPVTGSFPARVITKDRQIDAASNLFQVQLKLPNPGFAIPAGLRCGVVFNAATAPKPAEPRPSSPAR